MASPADPIKALAEFDNVRWDDVWAAVERVDPYLAKMSRKYVGYARGDIIKALSRTDEQDDVSPTTAHPVYPGGEPCAVSCPGPWSQYHDGYSWGYEHGSSEARAQALQHIGWTADDQANHDEHDAAIRAQADASLVALQEALTTLLTDAGVGIGGWKTDAERHAQAVLFDTAPAAARITAEIEQAAVAPWREAVELCTSLCPARALLAGEGEAHGG